MSVSNTVHGPAIEVAVPLPAGGRVRWPWRRLSAGLLALPVCLFLGIFFFYPATNLLFFSVLTQDAKGVVGRPLTVAHFAHFFATSLYLKVFWTTLRISLVTALAAALLAYPVALVIVRSRPVVARIVNLIVIAPLLVSVVVRAYGWQLILANGPAGVLNKLLLSLGVVNAPLSLLYSDAAVVIGSLHVFFPMMVLPLVSALGKVDANLEDAARVLGAPAWRVFLRVTLPLSLPGLLLGSALVFTLTAGSFVTPAILGGTNAVMLGNLIEQQIFVVYDWPFGATIAAMLVGVVLAVNALSSRLLRSRHLAAGSNA
jgi:putative spermidine/putrescine transport system permease protein